MFAFSNILLFTGFVCNHLDDIGCVLVTNNSFFSIFPFCECTICIYLELQTMLDFQILRNLRIHNTSQWCVHFLCFDTESPAYLVFTVESYIIYQLTKVINLQVWHVHIHTVGISSSQLQDLLHTTNSEGSFWNKHISMIFFRMNLGWKNI